MRILEAPPPAPAKPTSTTRARGPRRAWEPAISALADPVARQLAALGRIRSYAANSLIIRENDPADALFVILAGSVTVFVSDANGREMVLGQYGASAYVGEMALDGQVRCASVRALEPTLCAVVSRRSLRRAVGADPQLALRMLATASRRTRAATGVVKSLALSDVYSRVASLLASLQTIEIDGRPWSREPLRQLDIAKRVGASRDMVSKVLKQLRLGGYIAVNERRISVLRRPPARW